MSLKNAWLGLIGEWAVPDPIRTTVYVDRIVHGDAVPATLYAVKAYDTSDLRFTDSIPAHQLQFLPFKLKYYASCEQAHAENRGAEVQVVDAFKVGGIYVNGQFAWQIEVQPKPKVAKGRK